MGSGLWVQGSGFRVQGCGGGFAANINMAMPEGGWVAGFPFGDTKHRLLDRG